MGNIIGIICIVLFVLLFIGCLRNEKRKQEIVNVLMQRKILATEMNVEEALKNISGVKSARVEPIKEPGKVLINVRYKFWTYLWFGLNRKVSDKVNDYIYKHRPFNVSMSQVRNKE